MNESLNQTEPPAAPQEEHGWGQTAVANPQHSTVVESKSKQGRSQPCADLRGERERERALTLSKVGREHAAAADASRWRKMRSEPRAEVPAIRGARSREGGWTVGAGGDVMRLRCGVGTARTPSSLDRGGRGDGGGDRWVWGRKRKARGTRERKRSTKARARRDRRKREWSRLVVAGWSISRGPWGHELAG